MDSAVTLRTATAADEAGLFACPFACLFSGYRAALHDAVAAIWGWDEDWQLQDFSDHFAPAEAIVAACSGAVIGYCQVERQPARMSVRMLVVHPLHQRRNIGGRLLDEALRSTAGAGMPVALQVFKINPQARRFYERRGFRVSGETGTSLEMSRGPVGD